MAATNEHHNVRLMDLETLEWIGSDAHVVGDQLAYAPGGSQFAALQADRIRFWGGRSGDYEASLALPADLTADPSISYLPGSAGGSSPPTTEGREGEHPHEYLGSQSLQDRRPQPDPGGVADFFPGSPYRLACPDWPGDT